MLLLTGADAGRFVRDLDAALASELQPVGVELEILDAPATADLSAQGELPDGVRVVGRVSQAALLGLPVSFASGRERSYVRDWETEVAQAARIADPKIDIVEDGWFATARVVRPVRGGQLRLHLTLDLQRVEELRRTSITINSAMTALAAVSDDQRTPAVWLPQDDVWVEQPVMRAMRVDTVMELDHQGQGALRRSASSLFGEGRVLVVRARVR